MSEDIGKAKLDKWWMKGEWESGCWRETTIRGWRKRAAVVVSAGFSVQQWKALCVGVNKGG